MTIDDRPDLPATISLPVTTIAPIPRNIPIADILLLVALSPTLDTLITLHILLMLLGLVIRLVGDRVVIIRRPGYQLPLLLTTTMTVDVVRL